MDLLNKKTSVLIATFSPWKNEKRLPINGNLEPMLDFFVPKIKKTVLIDQPYPGSDFLMPRIEVYERNKKAQIYTSSKWINFLHPFLKANNYNATHISFKMRDFLSVLDRGMRDKEKYDYFIGFESINALAGIFLRRFGKVKKVIYYVSDYSPKRYKKQWFNRLYIWLDRFCAINSDYIWDVSPAMYPARIKEGLDRKKCSPVLNVPNALYPSQIKYSPLNKIIPYSLVFMGTLGIENGPDLAICAMPVILKKFSESILHIIGGNENDIKRLNNLVKKLNVEKFIVFHGFISNREEISKAIRNYQIALAPYIAINGSPRWYGDATKIRAYLASGLPVVTTQVPPLGKDASKAGAAVIVNDNADELAKGIMDIFSDRKKYLNMRKKAIFFAKDNTWENEYNKAFKEMKKF